MEDGVHGSLAMAKPIQLSTNWHVWLLIPVAAFLLASCRTSPEKREATFLQTGDSLVQRKDYARATLEYRNAVQVRPKDAEPYYRLGLLFEKMGNPRDAVTAYRQALQLSPQHAGAQLRLAGLMAVFGDAQALAEAEKRLQSYSPDSSSGLEVLDTLAVAKLRLGKADEAASLLEQSILQYPADLEPAVLLARLKLAQRDFPGAEHALQEAVRKAPRSPDAAVALARLYLEANHPEQAEPELRRALKLDSQFGPALLSLAVLETKRNRLDQAEQIYKQLSTNHDKDYQSLYALFLFQHGKTEPALQEFQRLARQNPDDRTTRTNLVAAYVALHRMPDARKILDNVLKKNGRDVDALIQRAGLSLQSNDLTGAERDLNQAVHEAPDSAPAHFELALLTRMQGLASRERQELLAALLHDAAYLPARLALARNYIEANEYKPALELIDSAPKDQAGMRELRIQRNWALLGLGEKQTARTEIAQLLAASRSTDALELDGFLKMADRDFTGARADAEDVLAHNPEDLRAIRLLVDSYTAANQRAAGNQRLGEIAAQHPKSALLQDALGRALLSSGDHDNARKAFEAALGVDPEFVAAQLALGQIDFLENRLDSARSHVAAALKAQPRNITALSAAGDIEMRAGDFNSALEKYHAVLDVDSSNVPALMVSATLLTLGKDLEAARTAAERAVELAPENPHAQETLAWVQYSAGNYSAAVEHLKVALERGQTPSLQYHLGLTYLKGGQDSLGRAAVTAALKKDPELPRKEHFW